MARGAFERGFEAYGADILSRVSSLGEANGGRVRFAYTGAYPPAPEPRFRTVDFAAHASMDLAGGGAPGVPGWMATMPDDHMADLPIGAQTFAGVPFLVTDPATNGRRGVVAVSRREGFPERVEIPIGTTSGSIYVLHTTGDHGNTKLAGAIAFVYGDGTDATQYVVRDGNVSSLVVSAARRLVAAGLRPAAPSPSREAPVDGPQRRLPVGGSLLVRLRQLGLRRLHGRAARPAHIPGSLPAGGHRERRRDRAQGYSAGIAGKMLRVRRRRRWKGWSSSSYSRPRRSSSSFRSSRSWWRAAPCRG